MKKSDLLKILDNEIVNKIYGFCYSRTTNSYMAEELSSDIVYALIKSSHTEGEIVDVYAFIWKVARNVYAEFSQKENKPLALQKCSCFGCGSFN